ncbi:hypothetical protein VP01_2284g2, partial [Puccinia sorghi]
MAASKASKVRIMNIKPYVPAQPTRKILTTQALQKVQSTIPIKQPVESLSNFSNQLFPSTFPRQTRHDQKQARIKALGPKNKVMQNYLVRKYLTNKTIDAIDPSLHLAHLEPEVNP